MIIPLFVMYGGCPHRCIFCNVKKTAGLQDGPISTASLRKTVEAYLATARKNTPVQIAFYGGSFTAMARQYQAELLGAARSLLKGGLIDGIRISTRPDCLDEERIALLTEFGVGTVEIGVQSLVDDVLTRAGRGHSAADVRGAMARLKKRGFETGVQLMVGLPGDSPARFARTVEETIALAPALVRIHPTLVLPETPLAEAYARGEYKPLSMTDAVETCKWALRKFAAAGVPVVRIGLQATAELEAADGVIAGPFHPAFRSLVEESLFLDMAASLLASGEASGESACFSLSPRDISHLRGRKNSNLRLLRERFGLTDIAVCTDPEQKRGSLALRAADGTLRHTSFSAPPLDNIPDWL